MRRIARVLATSAIVFSIISREAFSACVTDGGYAVQGTPCASDCFSFPLDSNIPYRGQNTPPTNPTTASGTTFCTTVPFSEYDYTKGPDRKYWGFCLCTPDPTNSPTVGQTSQTTSSPTAKVTGGKQYEEVWYADGGGVGLNHPENLNADGYQDCFLPFTFVSADGSEKIIENCASIKDLPPFLGSGNDFPYNPKNSSTDKKLWCPINSAVYDIDPPSQRIKERKDWGYCLLTLREILITASPTPKTVTASPTAKLTASPTSKTSITSSPTPLHTSSPIDSATQTNSPTIKGTTLTPTAFPNEGGEDDNKTASKPPVGNGAGSSGNRISLGLLWLTATVLATTQLVRL